MAKDIQKYYKIDKKTGCWVFENKLEHNGYGRICINYKRIRAHRYFYEKYKGLIKKGLMLDHLCRNRACVNPEHLEQVSCVENIHRGERCKLNKQKIIEIRTKYNNGETQTYLSKIFGVGQDEISRIVNFKRWKTI